jgi:uncharacterized protein YxjI
VFVFAAQTIFWEAHMNYPLDISFKLLALAQQLSVRDAQGNLVFYVKRKAFKLKEAITVFADEAQTRPLYHINADRIIDFSGTYRFTDNAGRSLGSIKRHGMRSLWKSHYEIDDASGGAAVTLTEENVWVKVLDSVLGQLPIVGALTGYLFHPAYLLARADGTVLLRMVKQPAFFEGKFRVERRAELDQAEETRALLGFVMMIMLERSRG